MPDSLTESLSAKLFQARKTRGLSARAAAELASRIEHVSHSTIINYEKGITRPSIEVLSGLAQAYQRPLNWFLQGGATLKDVRYRNVKSRVKVSDKHHYEGESQKWIDAYMAIEDHLSMPLMPSRSREKYVGMPPIEAAMAVRADFGIDQSDPVYSVMGILSEFGIRTIEVETKAPISGLAARLGDEYVVAVTSGTSPDRNRLNAAHELAHVLLGHCDSPGDETKQEENDSFELASHLLMPAKALEKAFKGKSMVRLVRYKEIFGISLAAMVYRAMDGSGIISQQMGKSLFIEFSKRGWRTNEPGAVRSDRAIRFEEMVDDAILGGGHSYASLASIGGVFESDLRQRIAEATGLDGSAIEMEEPRVTTHGLRLAR